MAFCLLNAVGAGVSSKWLDIRSVGTKMIEMRVYGCNNDHGMPVNIAPNADGSCSKALGIIPVGGGTIVIDEPADYLQVQTDAAEGLNPSAYVVTSR